MFSQEEVTALALSILDREKAKMRAKSVLDDAAPLLQELVDVGSATYALCLEITQRTDLHKPALALYRHVLEMTDAIQVLIENSCVDPVIPLSRSALEAALSLEYLSQKDYEHRSLVWRYHRLRKDLLQYDPEEQDDDVRELFSELGPQEKAELNMLRERVESYQYKDIHSRCKDLPPKDWYKWVLDGEKNGPANLYDLAIRLNRLIIYKTMYRLYSRVAHGDSYSYTEVLRHPEHIRDLTHRAAVLMKYSIGIMITMFMPSKIHVNSVWDLRMQARIDQLIETRVDFDSPNADGSPL
ncbi:MAG: DUF5677 domain-containing protein [Desulfomonilaceae bacterium]